MGGEDVKIGAGDKVAQAGISGLWIKTVVHRAMGYCLLSVHQGARSVVLWSSGVIAADPERFVCRAIGMLQQCRVGLASLTSF